MSEHEINFRWCRWNFEGRGKVHGGGPRDNHWYHDSVRYYGNHPSQRWVRAPNRGNMPVLLFKSLSPACNDTTIGSKHTGFKTQAGYAHRHDQVEVQDLGVFSRFPGDMLAGDQLHERSRFIMLSCISQFVMEEVPAMTADMLDTAMEVKLRAKLGIWADRYDIYSRLFALDWPGVPSMYFDKFEDTVSGKQRGYNDPEAVRRRERAAARRLAVKALELDSK